MNIKLNKLILIFFLQISSLSYAQQWPIRETDDPGCFNQVNCTFGEIHGTTTSPHFHEGIDIDVCTVDCPIRSIDDGRIPPDGILTSTIVVYHEFPSGVYNRVSRYLHVHTANFAISVGEVNQGEQLSIVNNNDGHLHFEMWQIDNGIEYRLNPLTNDTGWQLGSPDDTDDPEINNVFLMPLAQTNNVGSGYDIQLTNGAISNYYNNTSAKIHMQDRPGSNGTIYNEANNELIIWGNIVPIVNVRDTRINAVPASQGDGLTIKILRYFIDNQNKFNLDFDRLIHAERNLVQEVFHTEFNTGNGMLWGNNDFIELYSDNNTYVYPQKRINNIQSNGVWFTKALNTSGHVFNQTPTNFAAVNSEVLYSDGVHTLRFETEDAAGNTDDENTSIDVIVDNFRPYIKKVEVRNSNDEVVYIGNWEWNETALEFNTQNGVALSEQETVSIKVYTSEPMQQVELTVFGVAKTITEAMEETNDREWLFEYTASEVTDGENQLVFSSANSTDLAGNTLWGFTSTSNITAANIPKHQNDGSWNPVVTYVDDNIHKFNIENCGSLSLDFAATKNSMDGPLSVVFENNSSTSNNNNWLWDFGDGNTSTERNPSYAYKKSGKFNVTLKYTACADKIFSKNNYINILPAYIESVDISQNSEIIPSIEFLREFDNANQLWSFQKTDNYEVTEETTLNISVKTSLPIKSFKIEVFNGNALIYNTELTSEESEQKRDWDFLIPSEKISVGLFNVKFSGKDFSDVAIIKVENPIIENVFIDENQTGWNFYSTIKPLIGTDDNYKFFVKGEVGENPEDFLDVIVKNNCDDNVEITIANYSDKIYIIRIDDYTEYIESVRPYRYTTIQLNTVDKPFRIYIKEQRKINGLWYSVIILTRIIGFSN